MLIWVKIWFVFLQNSFYSNKTIRCSCLLKKKHWSKSKKYFMKNFQKLLEILFANGFKQNLSIWMILGNNNNYKTANTRTPNNKTANTRTHDKKRYNKSVNTPMSDSLTRYFAGNVIWRDISWLSYEVISHEVKMIISKNLYFQFS